MSIQRYVAMVLLVGALAQSGCAKERDVVTKSAAPVEASAPEAGITFSGAIVETMDAATYTYVHLKAQDGSELWVAGPKTPVTVGQVLTVKGGFEMKSFKSSALERTFERLVMVNSLGGPEPTVSPEKAEAAPHGAMGGAAHGMGADVAAAPGAPSVPATITAGSVPKAEGETGHTIAEVHAQAADLNGKGVAVRGVVVKVSIGIMSRNWIHIQDGTGAAGKGDHDLTLTTEATAKAGDRVLVTGTLAADRDFGAGYKYKAIVEQATVTVE